MTRPALLLITSAVFLFSACASIQRETGPALSCNGPIEGSTSRQDLAVLYGEDLRDEEIEIGEGETVEATVIYQDDPARRVEELWRDPATKRSVSSVRVLEPSEWTVHGLNTGVDLATVERLNGRPFSLHGFDWDYAGTVASWNAGAFDLGGACRVLARFRPADGVDSGDSLSGESVFGSDDPRIQQVDVRVYELLLLFE